MMKTTRVLVRCVPAVTVAVASMPLIAADKPDANWPGFRGPRASGVVDGFETVTKWNVDTGENIRWKTPIPGLGHSCPIVWGDRVFVTTAISGQADPQLRVGLYGNIEPVDDDSVHQWLVLCVDRRTGEIVWQRKAHEGIPKIKRHTKATHANSTPATDGRFVVAFFGSEGLHCYDTDGKRQWTKDLGVLDAGYYRVPEAQWEFGSSPVIHDGRVIVQCDVQRNSFLAAFDLATGRELWRTPRDEVPTWSTPTVAPRNDGLQIIVNGYKHIGGYAFDDGTPLWTLRGGGDIPVPTPVVSGDLVYITNAHGSMAPIYAIRLDAQGDVSLPDGETSNEAVAWSYRRRGNYMQTPIVVDGHLYMCRGNGVLVCYNARNGERLNEQRLGTGSTGFTASAVAADGKIYITSETGDVYVVAASPKQTLLAENQLGETCLATPAIAAGDLFFRTQNHLIAVGSGNR